MIPAHVHYVIELLEMAMGHDADLRGYALLDIEAGREPGFFSGLYDIPGVMDVYFIGDDYEFVVTVRAGSHEEMARLMATRIRTLPGVARMASYIEGHHLRLP